MVTKKVKVTQLLKAVKFSKDKSIINYTNKASLSLFPFMKDVMKSSHD